MGTAVFLAVLLVIVGLALFDIGRRARSGNLRRNWIVGLRTIETLRSDDAWDAAHRAGGVLLGFAGIGPVIGGAILVFRPSNIVGALAALSAIIWLLVFVLVAATKGRRAAREAVSALSDPAGPAAS